MIENKIKESRELAISYFRQNGLSEKKKSALVDVGWTLKTQHALKQLLSLSGNDSLSRGYYLGVVADAIEAPEIPVFRTFFQELPRHLDQEQRHNYFFRNANLIEQVFMGNPEGTVLGYQRRSQRVEPVLAKGETDPDKRQFFKAVEAAVVCFSQTCPASFLDWPKRRMLRLAEAHLEEFICRSGMDLAGRIGAFSVKDDQLESRSRPLAKPVTFVNLLVALLKISQSYNGGRYSRSFDWIEGAVELSNPIVRKILKTRSGYELLRSYRKSF
jgi:hypothetical protein